MKKTAAILFAAVCCPVLSFSQTDTVGPIPASAYFGVYAHRLSGDTLTVFTGAEKVDAYMTKISLTDFGKVTGPVIGRIQGLKQTAGGVFHLEYQAQSVYTGQHVIRFVPDNGTAFVSVAVNQYNEWNTGYWPAFPTAVGDRFYVDGYVGNQYCIWESDGTSAGTAIIAQTTGPLTAMGNSGSRLWYIAENAADFMLYSFETGQSPQIVQVFPKSSWNTLTGLTSDANAVYFRLENTSGVASVWKTGLQPNDAVQLVDAFDADAMQVTGNAFVLQDNLDFYRGNLSNPAALVSVQYPADMPQSAIRDLQLIGDDYLYINTFEKGRELARFTAGNAIELIDMVPGPGTGTYGFSQPDDGVLYAATLSLVSNGLPAVYRYDNGVTDPLFRIGATGSVKTLFVEGEYLYWAEGEAGALTLLRRKLIDTETFPPAQSGEWLREAWITYRPDVYDQGYARYNRGAFISDDGDVTIGFTLAQNMASNMTFCSSYEDTVITPEGRDMFVRYDTYGNLMWMRSIGGTSHETGGDGSFVLTADDDLVAAGLFTIEGVFGNETVTVPGPNNPAFMYAAKLDGETGNVLWKTILHEGDGVEPEAMTTDPAGNTYLSFRYQGASVNIAGNVLQSDVLWMNALVKIDPDGNVLWAKNMPTPWQDVYGFTYVMRFDANAGTVLSVQCRGDFTTWPGTPLNYWPAYVQTLDAEGNLLQAYDYATTGLGLITTGEIQENGNYFLAGYFQGELAAPPFYTSTEISGIYPSEGYRMLLGMQDYAPTSIAMSHGKPFYPFSSATADGFVYLVGANGNNRLELQKYTQSGAYIGSKTYDEYTYLYNEEYRYNYIAARDGHIAILASRFFTRPQHNIFPALDGYRAAELLKVRDEGWVNDQQFEEVGMPVNWAALETDFVVYPNNFEDDLYIRFRNEDHGFRSYKLYDLNGKLLASGDIGKDQLQVLHFGSMGRGMLMLKLLGDEEQTVKVVHAF